MVKITPMSRSEWLHKMGTKENQLRALREGRTGRGETPSADQAPPGATSEAIPPQRGPERGSLAGPLADPTGRGEGTGTELKPGQDTNRGSMESPRAEPPPARLRGRPLKGLEANTLQALAPWTDEGISRRTWYRRQKR
jgi:hypothetical protein